MLEQLYSAPPLLGIVGLAIAFFIYTVMSRREVPEGKVQKIGEQIHLGAMVFMKREYTYLAMARYVRGDKSKRSNSHRGKHRRGGKCAVSGVLRRLHYGAVCCVTGSHWTWKPLFLLRRRP